MANRVPLILNTSSNQIQELPTGDNLDLSNSGIHNAGVITATSFTGDGSALTGLTAAGTGAIGGLTVKDEGSVVGTAGSISSFDFRGSYITATANTGAAGVTTVTLSETPTFSTVTVTNNINANGRIVGAATSNVIPFLYSNYSDLPSAATYHGAFAHVHATQKAYYAHGGNWIELVNKDTNGNIVGDNSTNITGIAGVTASTLTGTLQTAAQPNITSLGTLSSLSVTGNVSVGGTLTYEDVNNVDAVGLITARSGVNISGGELKVGTGVTVGQSGIVSATAFSGNVNSQDGTASVLIPGAGTGDWSQLYNTVLYNSNGQAILTPTAGSEHFAGDSDGFTAGNASNLNAGTVPTVRLGSGTANSSSFLRGDQTWAAVTSTTINNNADNRIITGSGTANTLNGEANFTFDGTNLVLAEGVEIKMGTSSNLEIISISGNKARIQSQQEDLYIETAASKSIILKTNRNGTYAGWSINADGDLIPSADSTVDIGTNTVRVQNFYADTLYGDGSNLTGIAGGVTSDAQGNTVGGTNSGDSFTGTDANYNTLYGYDTGTAISTSDNNTCIGYQAGKSITTKAGNTCIGYQAGYSGNLEYNVCVGHKAGYSITGGSNQAIGLEAMGNATSASTCQAIGNYALQNGGSSEYMIAIGQQALQWPSSGVDKCIALGRSALRNVSANNNIAIGYNAGNDNSNTVSGAGNIIIGDEGANTLAAGANNLLLGLQVAQSLTSGSNNIVLGYDAEPSSASVSNEITLGDANITKFRIPGIKFEAENGSYHFNCDHNLASWVQRTDGVWGNWSPEFNFKATSASPAGTTFGQWGNHAEGHQIVFVKSRNNGTSGTTCQAGDDLGSIFWSPYNSNNPGCSAAVKVMADSGTWSSTSNPAYMQIMTTPNGSKEPTERLRIAAHGGVIFKGGPLQEKVKITAGKLSNNTNIDLADGNVHYFTTQESTTSTPNLRVNSSITLNSVMATGETVAVTIITTAAAAGYSAQLQIDGANVTENWVGGTAPAAGGASGVDIYNYTIIKTGNSAFTVIGNLTKTSA